jgi:hypothetical protein
MTDSTLIRVKSESLRVKQPQQTYYRTRTLSTRTCSRTGASHLDRQSAFDVFSA